MRWHREVLNERGSSMLDEALRDDAIDALHYVVHWRLSGPCWAAVRETLAAMRAALDAGDDRALRAAVGALEVAGPVRGNSLGGPPIEGMAPFVFDVANELVHELSGGDESLSPPPEDPQPH